MNPGLMRATRLLPRLWRWSVFFHSASTIRMSSSIKPKKRRPGVDLHCDVWIKAIRCGNEVSSASFAAVTVAMSRLEEVDPSYRCHVPSRIFVFHFIPRGTGCNLPIGNLGDVREATRKYTGNQKRNNKNNSIKNTHKTCRNPRKINEKWSYRSRWRPMGKRSWRFSSRMIGCRKNRHVDSQKCET